MTDLDSDSLPFEGTSPRECEVFVSSIRRRALAQGKHRDNEWMAVFASSCFVEDAFYWYEGLDEDTQNDWSRLRPALVARFGRGDLISTTTSGTSWTPASAPSTSIPTPAAAPPESLALQILDMSSQALLGPKGTVVTRPSVRMGYLKVHRSGGGLRGYLAKQLDRNGAYPGLSRNVSDALLVCFSVSSENEAFEIQIIDAFHHSRTNDVLAIEWPNLSGNNWMDEKWYTAKCCSFLTVTSKREWAIERKVWKISKEGEFSVEYPKPDGGTESLYCSVESAILFRKCITKESKRGRIVFEDVA